MELNPGGGEGDLRGVGGGETIIKIYCVKKIFNKLTKPS